ncbi:MAG: hypothetical protein ACP5IO_05450 [Elusimicrobiales bacterium]
MERMKSLMIAIIVTCIAVMVNTAYAEYNRGANNYGDDNGTEFGAQDDLVVLGTQGNWFDPDVEIYGFTIFGSTVGVTPKISPSTGSVFIGGNLQVESTAYIKGLEIPQAGDISSLKFPGGTARKVLRMRSDGYVEFADPNDLGVAGDNLGNHIATKTLDMAGYDIINLKNLQFGNANLIISTNSANFGGAGSAVYISTNVDVKGEIRVGSDATIISSATIGGTLGVTGAVTLSNNLTVNGDTTVKGNTTIGDNSTNTLTIKPAAVKLGNLSEANSKVEYKDSDGNKTVAFFIKKVR